MMCVWWSSLWQNPCLHIYFYTIFPVCFRPYYRFVYFWWRSMITISRTHRRTMHMHTV